MISICTPTRRRPEMFKQMCLSLLNTAFEPNDIEFISYHDEDDDSVYEYVGNHREIVGARVGAHVGANECQKAGKGDIYMFMADDLLVETPGWDVKVKMAFDQCPDKILFVHFNDHRRRSGFGNVGFLHKNWIDTVGYGMRPDIVRRGDCWINDVARKLERKHYIREVGVTNVDIRTDDTHLEYMSKARDTNCLEEYKSERMHLARAKDVELLQNFINNFK